MRLGHRWAAGAIGLIVIAAALLALTLGTPARQDRLEAARIALDRGIHLYQQGAYDAARIELDKAREANPDEWRTPYYLGIIQIHLKQYGKAIPPLEQAFLLNPSQPKVPNALGVAYFKLGKLDLAKGYFATSVELDPDNADTRAMLETMTRLQRRAEQSGALPEG
jgi:type IV pilus assembly protein PilF